MHLIKHFSFLFSVFLISTLLSACGSKGDLYQVVEPTSTPEQSDVIIAPQPKNKDTQKKTK
jgi:hypothetical protein